MTAPRHRLLIVEDDPDHADLIRRGFEDDPQAETYELVVARTLKDARRHLKAGRLSLVITDLRLPDGEGVALIEDDRDTAPYPVVVMTSFGDQRVAVEAMRKGALDYVVKSDASLLQMAQVARRALREWSQYVERRAAEAALRKSEAHFRSVIENALDLIVVLDDLGRVRYASPSVQRTLHWEAKDLVGTLAFDLVHPEDREQAQATLRGLLAEPGPPRSATLRLRTREGQWRTHEAVGQAAPGGSASPTVVVNARDITERLRAEESQRKLESRLRQAQRLEALGVLAGGVAHDFNNILQGVMACTEVALRKVGDDSPARRYLDESLEASRRGQEIVEQIFELSRGRDRNLEPVALAEVVEEAVTLLRAAFPETVEIRARISTSGRVMGEAAQLHQVLLNLATNARQAMNDQGTIEIAVERIPLGGVLPPGRPPAPQLVMTVTDDGPGIPPEIEQRIFEPFFSARGVGEGTGLGLAVVHRIVKGHAGAIVCESEPGRGACFRVFLAEA